MPNLADEDVVFTGFSPLGKTQEPDTDIGYFDALPAAFRMDNTLSSHFNNKVRDIVSVENADYDPFSTLTDEDDWSRFVYADSDDDVSRIKNQINREMADRETVESAGPLGVFASITAGIIDPINFIPFGGAAYRTYRTGGSILRGAGTTAYAGFLGGSVSEAALQNTQITRTFGESVMNVAASTLLSGVLGGSISAFRGMARNSGRSVADIEAEIEHDLTIAMDGPSSGGGSVGAASAKGLDRQTIAVIEQEVRQMVLDGKIADIEEGIEVAKRITGTLLGREGMQTNWAVDAALRLVGQNDPTLRLIQSPSIIARNLAAQISEYTIVLEKNRFGVASEVPVQALIRGYDAGEYRAIIGLDNDYSQYVIGRRKIFSDKVRINIGKRLGAYSGKMTIQEFKDAVGMATRRDYDISGVEGIPQDAVEHINRASKRWYTEVYEPIQKSLESDELGLLKQGATPKTAETYLNRVYDIAKLSLPKYRQRFIKVTSEWLAMKKGDAIKRNLTSKKEIRALTKKAKSGKNKDKIALAARKALHDRDIRDSGMEQVELESLAAKILDRIRGTPFGRLPYDVSIEKVSGGPGGRVGSKPGPLKERVFLIPDELIEFALVNDIEMLAKRYIRSMAPEIELRKKFGSTDLIKQVTEIEDDYARMMNRPGADTVKLTKSKDKDLRDLRGLLETVLNVRGLPDNPMDIVPRVGRSIRQLNYISMLGGMAMSALPDVARPIMVHGVIRTFRDGLIPLVTNFSNMGKLTQQMRDMGLATDMVQNSRAYQLAGISDDVPRLTLAERGLGAASDTMGMVTIMSPWNTAFKQITAIVSMNRIIRGINAEISGKISKKEMTFLRGNYIGKEEGLAIRKMLDGHSSVEGGINMPNALAWEDPVSYSVFQAALNRDVDRIIVTPGLDKPLLATGSETGRHAFQFTSFAFASTQRILLSGLQQADLNALSGALLSVSLGMASTSFKMWDSGRGDELKDWTLEKWVGEGLDRSGLLAWLPQLNRGLEVLSGGELSAMKLLGAPPLTKGSFNSGVAGSVAGPTFGMVNSIERAVRAAATPFGDEEWTAADTHALRRILPYHNLSLWRQLFDKAEKNINQAVGVSR